MNWKEKHFRYYIIARLPQLHSLDGNEIKKSERIIALQRISELELLLKDLCNIEEKEKNEDKDKDIKEGLTEHSPVVREEICREQANQIAEKEAVNKKTHFKNEDEIFDEHQAAVLASHEREQQVKIDDKPIRMKNGKLLPHHVYNNFTY